MITPIVLAAAVYWSGHVVTPAGRLPIGIALADRAATLDAPALGYVDKPITASVDGPHVRLEMRVDDVTASADATAEGEAMRGNVTIGGNTYALDLQRAARPPKTYRTEELTLRNGDVSLAATLYLPNAPAPLPAVAFVAGLVPRSDAVHFLADRFASSGIAVLTYDRRGVGRSTGGRATFAEHASDAAAAVEYLRARKEIDPKRVGIRGQSQGAWLAPLAAMHAPVAFIIATAGGGVPPWQSERYAIPARMRADGFSQAEIDEATRYMEKLFEVGRSGKGWDEVAAMMEKLRAGKARWFGTYGPVYPSLERLRSAWEGDFSYDPEPALRAVKVPYLALVGEKDVYSPPAETLRALERLLTTPSKTLRMIRNATHDFHVAGAPLPLVSEEYLSTLLDWTAKQTASAATSARRVEDHTIVSTDPRLTIEVDPTLRYVATIAIDIRNSARAERVIFAEADAGGNVRRLFVAQFESMLPTHQGSYDELKGPTVRIGPYDFLQQTGRYSFAASIKAKPGLEAERTRDALLEHGLRLPEDLTVARFETRTDAARRSELILFYWEAGAAPGDAFAARARQIFALNDPHHVVTP